MINLRGKRKALGLGLLTAVIGGFVGYGVSDGTSISIDELTTPSSTFVGTDQNVAFANNLGLATFDGSWVQVSGEEMVNDINAVSIDCWLETGLCNVAQADVIFDDMFTNNIGYYQIVEWSASGQITAVTSSACEETIIKADIKSKVVTLTESPLEDANPEFCTEAFEPVVLKLGPRGY